jgi:N-acetylglucosamine-6-sulfatase
VRGVWRITTLLCTFLALVLIGADEADAQARPNVVLVLTDDQRWDTLNHMPTVQAELIGRGVRFTNALVTTPLCCPSRATVLTGRYSHGTGVYGNLGRHGGVGAFTASSTVATWLKSAGYSTALIGKYLNGYVGPAVPPGWGRWVAFSGPPGYYDYTLSVDGNGVAHGSTPADYSTDLLAAEAEAFIRSAEAPFFLHFSPFAPHHRRGNTLTVLPAPRHRGLFASLPPWRPPSFNEADVSDKPSWLRFKTPPLSQDMLDDIDLFRQRQLESLLAVDDAVGRILDALSDTGQLSNTMFVFASDNGNDWGEHRRLSKLAPYETNIRIPLVVRYDALVGTPRADGRLAANVDIAPTIADIAGTAAPGAQGRSLVPAIENASSPWRRDFLLEYLGGPGRSLIPTYCGIRSRTHTYVQYGTGEEEIYDLTTDPHQLENQAYAPSMRQLLMAFRQRTVSLCSPPPPRFTPRDPCLISGDDRANRLRGTPWFDYICSYAGADRIKAGAGDDIVAAGRGNDLVYGQGGPDRIWGGPGVDRLYGGIGGDVINSVDAERDVVNCGAGLDIVHADRVDSTSGCETVRRP